MYEVLHELSNDQENKYIFVKWQHWIHTYSSAKYVPSSILWKSVGPTTDLKTKKNVVYNKPYYVKAFNEILLLENTI